MICNIRAHEYSMWGTIIIHVHEHYKSCARILKILRTNMYDDVNNDMNTYEIPTWLMILIYAHEYY